MHDKTVIYNSGLFAWAITALGALLQRMYYLNYAYITNGLNCAFGFGYKHMTNTYISVVALR